MHLDRLLGNLPGQDYIVLGDVNFAQLSIQKRNDDVLIFHGKERFLLSQNTNVGDINEADFV